MMGAFFNWSEQEVAICMPGTSTPGWLSVNKDDVITKVSESVRMPHTESVFKTVQEHYFAFSSGQPHHFRRSGNCCYLSGTWEAVKFIQNFVNCQSSVRSGREAKYINVPTLSIDN